jgi:putative cardiolipin synthase
VVARTVYKSPARQLLAVIGLCVVMAGCSTLPKDFARTESYALDNTSDTYLGKRYGPKLALHPGKSGVVLLDNGLDAFVARVVLAEKAERSIDSQYYLYHRDQTGRIFTHQLIKAADRGVRVRLLVDDMDQAGRDLGAAALDQHPNIEVRLFNPFSRNSPRTVQLLTRFGKVTRRMHNKSLTIDQQVSVLGGRNIGDEYFDATRDKNFTDLDALVIGPVVEEVSTSFDYFWNSELSYPASVLSKKQPTEEMVQEMHDGLEQYVNELKESEYLQALHTSPLAANIRSESVVFDWSNVTAVYDRPEKIEIDSDLKKYHLAPALKDSFAGVREELIIISPYFVPGKKGSAFLQELAAQGIKVRILTNSLSSTDVPVVHAGYLKYRKDLLRAGIEIHEVRKNQGGNFGAGSGWKGSSTASLHSKSFVFDRHQVFIGSLNLDLRSINENTEIGVVIDSREIAADMVNWFEEFSANRSYRLSLEKSWIGTKEVRWHEPAQTGGTVWKHEPESGFLLRTGMQIFRYLPIESQL